MNELEIDGFLSDYEDEEKKQEELNQETIQIKASDGLIERIDKKCITSCGKELLND
jgi:hypothetical protein